MKLKYALYSAGTTMRTLQRAHFRETGLGGSLVAGEGNVNKFRVIFKYTNSRAPLSLIRARSPQPTVPNRNATLLLHMQIYFFLVALSFALIYGNFAYVSMLGVFILGQIIINMAMRAGEPAYGCHSRSMPNAESQPQQNGT